jgi:hypothetical protein
VGIYFRSRRGRYLATLATGLSLLVTPAWVVLDEFVLDWANWLPTWPTLIANGLIPLAILVLGLISLDEWIKRSFDADLEERILFLFVFIFIALIVLTVIGIFFRGSGMSLIWPWAIEVHA